MTVLVDAAVWPWRGERWAHLASDRCVDELHDFASTLGLRRLAFQGDHYDVPASVRARALQLGANAVTSRELVRRLRAAGLRRRGPAAIVRWDRVLVADAGSVASWEELEALFVRAVGHDGWLRARPTVLAVVGAVPATDLSAMAFTRAENLALAFEVPAGVPVGAGPHGTTFVSLHGARTLVEVLVG